MLLQVIGILALCSTAFADTTGGPVAIYQFDDDISAAKGRAAVTYAPSAERWWQDKDGAWRIAYGDSPRLHGAELTTQNLQQYSNDLTDAVWTKNNVTLTTWATDNRVVEAATTSTHQIHDTPPDIQNNTYYTFFAEVKAAEVTHCEMIFVNKAGNYRTAQYYLASGTYTSPANVEAGIVDLSDGKYRVWIAADSLSGATTPQVIFRLHNGTTSNYLGNIDNGLIVYRMGVVPGSGAPYGSEIDTTTEPVGIVSRLANPYHHMLVVGDSISDFLSLADSNADADGSEGYVDYLRQNLGVSVKNRGIAGETLTQIEARFATELALDPPPNAVIIQGGTNDVFGAVAQATMEAKLEAMVAAATAAGIAAANIILPSLTAFGDNETQRTATTNYNSYLSSYATTNGHTYVDLHTVTVDTADPDGVGDLLDAYQNGTDTTHPNQAGQEAIGAAILAALDQNYKPATTLKGFLVEPARTNYLLNSLAPATQTTGSLGTGTYTCWLTGTGQIDITAGTATIGAVTAVTDGSPCTFSVTGAGTVTATLTGSATRIQLEDGRTPTSFIETGGATATRVADGDVVICPASIINLHEGAMLIELYPPFDRSDIEDGGTNEWSVLTLNGAYRNLLDIVQFTGSNPVLRAYSDSTNTQSPALDSWTDGDILRVYIRWSKTKNEKQITAGLSGGAAKTDVTPATYSTGFVTTGDALTYAAVDELGMRLKSITIWDHDLGIEYGEAEVVK